MDNPNLTVEMIINILNECDSIENILSLINNKIEIISNCCSKEKQIIIMSTFKIAKKTDNLENISYYLVKNLINHYLN